MRVPTRIAGRINPVYRVWHQMNQRCHNRNDKRYKYYGGRGVRVCKRWRSPHGFQAFCADMGDRPKGGTLERKENRLGYSPSNCVWATMAEQNRNSRNTTFYTLDGVTLCLKDWATKIGIPYKTLHYRVKTAGWSFAAAVKTPVRS